LSSMPNFDRNRRRTLRLGATMLGAVALAGCETLPRSGPLSVELDPPNDGETPEGLVARLTPDVAAAVATPSPRAFPDAFVRAPDIDPGALGVGDELDILVWEPGGATLFTGPSADPRQGASRIDSVRVNARGHVFVPFVGELHAAGRSAAALRAELRERLSRLTDAPEVDVRVAVARSREITVQGAVGAPGAYMLRRGFTRLTPVLALAGGSPLPPEQVEVSVRRGAAFGGEMLEDIYADPRLDIALRPGDVVVLNPIRERFVALGATTAQLEVTFPTRRLTLLSALGAVAGLRDFDADPEGLFVLRFEDAATADALLEGPPPPDVPSPRAPDGRALRPIVYRADLTTPEGLFGARAFLMRDGDVMLASNAPLAELRKITTLFTSVLTPVQQGSAIAP